LKKGTDGKRSRKESGGMKERKKKYTEGKKRKSERKELKKGMEE
jgi:hypothetical protein